MPVVQRRLVARQLHQTRVERGMRVLEVGAGSGYNAALLAELVGPTGQVVTVDIDPVVVESARAALAATGYTDRVTVVHADGVEPLGLGLFDRIVVTVGVWDIAPAWLEQLTAGGALVVPLRARHASECWSIELRHQGDLLVGESSMVCGFVDIQGTAGLDPDTALITGPNGGAVVARSWDHGTDLSGLPETLAEKSVMVPSGVVLPPPGMFIGLRTHLVYALPGLAELAFEDRNLLGHTTEQWVNIAQVDDDSLALLCYWPVDGGHEFGARGFGPRAQHMAEVLVEQVAAWGRAGMPQRAAHVYRPAGVKSPLDGTTMALPSGDLAVTLHHDGADDI
ncbi:methyltransferase domain-containing protein [Promicromonospora vindobonensis]|uniref:Protein-L-isoaspartate O-methyltransferase n=1 Tax=Promicromonospora vindobonensis TaxID=195748 RepID=A0ABW5VU29_9MICO